MSEQTRYIQDLTGCKSRIPFLTTGHTPGQSIGLVMLDHRYQDIGGTPPSRS